MFRMEWSCGANVIQSSWSKNRVHLKLIVILVSNHKSIWNPIEDKTILIFSLTISGRSVVKLQFQSDQRICSKSVDHITQSNCIYRILCVFTASQTEFHAHVLYWSISRSSLLWIKFAYLLPFVRSRAHNLQ